jgi:transcriptional regulator with XRE-family HTH domain
MARARPDLQNAITTILREHGKNGKKLSLRQAERMTGLSPATIGELANGNARTPETIRRFARGFQTDPRRLLLLAGFVPEEIDEREAASVAASPPAPLVYEPISEPDTQEWLGRFGRALAKMPPGRERELWKETLRRNTELLESFLSHLPDADEPDKILEPEN